MKQIQFNRFNRDIYTYFDKKQEISLDDFKKIMGRRYSRHIRANITSETTVPINQLLVDNIYDSSTSILSIGIYEPAGEGEEMGNTVAVFNIDVRRLLDGSDEDKLSTLIGTYLDIIKWNLDGTCFIRG